VGVEAGAVQIIRPSLKCLFGKTAYLIALIERLLRPVKKNICLQVKGKTWYTSQLIVLNGKYYAGPYQVSRETHIFQPEYTLLIWKSAGRLNWCCGMIARMLQWKISYLWVDEIKVNGDDFSIKGNANVQIDGSPGPKLPLTITQAVRRKIAIA